MKILFLCHSINVGGLETYILRFADWLTRNHPEHRLELLCKSGRFGSYQQEFRRLGIVLHAMPLGYGNPLQYLGFFRFLRLHRFDAVCDFSGDFGALPMVVSRASGSPRRLVFYRSARNPFVSAWYKRLYQLGVNRLVRLCSTRILGNSREGFSYYFAGYPLQGDRRFQVIRNGIPRSAPLSPEQRERLRGELGIPRGRKIVLHVGSGRWEKNHPCILEMARRAQDRGDQVTFCLVGPGVEELCAPLAGELENVRFLGERRDVGSLLQLADLFLFPSLSEGQPNALLEAMTAGLPFVASDIAPVREALPPDWGGRWLFAPHSPEEGYLLLRSHLENDFSNDPQFLALVAWCHKSYDQDACFGTFLRCLVDQAASGG